MGLIATKRMLDLTLGRMMFSVSLRLCLMLIKARTIRSGWCEVSFASELMLSFHFFLFPALFNAQLLVYPAPNDCSCVLLTSQNLVGAPSSLDLTVFNDYVLKGRALLVLEKITEDSICFFLLTEAWLTLSSIGRKKSLALWPPLLPVPLRSRNMRNFYYASRTECSAQHMKRLMISQK